MKKRYAKVGRYRVVAGQGWPFYLEGGCNIEIRCRDESGWHQVADGLMKDGSLTWSADSSICVSHDSPDDLADFCEALKTAYRLATEVVG